MHSKLPLFAVDEVAVIDLFVAGAQTVAPILSIGSDSLVAISTLTSEINFYTRLVRDMGGRCDDDVFYLFLRNKN